MQALNYSTQAIGGLHQWIEEAKKKGWKRSVDITATICAIIDNSHKFILPKNGSLFEKTPGSFIARARLPFPDTTIEFAIDTEHWDATIVACVDAVAGDHLGTEIWSVNRQRHSGRWLPPIGGVFYRYGQPEAYDPDGVPTYELAKIPNGEYFEDFATLSAADLGDLYHFQLRALFQLCAALQCRNVSTERLDPPVKLQAKRAKEGKLPLFSYHILTVGNANPSTHTGATGSHSSPRTHLRRGHIRNHPTAGFVWVQSCVVNPGAKGSVNKDYAVRASL